MTSCDNGIWRWQEQVMAGAGDGRSRRWQEWRQAGRLREAERRSGGVEQGLASFGLRWNGQAGLVWQRDWGRRDRKRRWRGSKYAALGWDQEEEEGVFTGDSIRARW
jgi:hypothetical protein